MVVRNKPYSILKFEIKDGKHIDVYLDNRLIKRVKLKKVKSPHFIHCSDALKNIRAIYKSYRELELHIHNKTFDEYELNEIINDCSKTIKYLYEWDKRITNESILDKIIDFFIFRLIRI